MKSPLSAVIIAKNNFVVNTDFLIKLSASWQKSKPYNCLHGFVIYMCLSYIPAGFKSNSVGDKRNEFRICWLAL